MGRTEAGHGANRVSTAVRCSTRPWWTPVRLRSPTASQRRRDRPPRLTVTGFVRDRRWPSHLQGPCPQARPGGGPAAEPRCRAPSRVGPPASDETGHPAVSGTAWHRGGGSRAGRSGRLGLPGPPVTRPRAGKPLPPPFPRSALSVGPFGRDGLPWGRAVCRARERKARRCTRCAPRPHPTKAN